VGSGFAIYGYGGTLAASRMSLFQRWSHMERFWSASGLTTDYGARDRRSIMVPYLNADCPAARTTDYIAMRVTDVAATCVQSQAAFVPATLVRYIARMGESIRPRMTVLLSKLVHSVKVMLSAIALIAAGSCCHAGTTGSAPATFDLQRFMNESIKSGARRIVAPPGRYRVLPQHSQHLVLRGLKDVEIIADGVEMVCTETTRALTISRCTNVVLRGLTIDYDPLPFTQGRITAISPDRNTYEVELLDGYPDASMVRNFKYEVFRPDTRTLRCEDRDVSRIETLTPRHLRLTCPGSHDRNPEQVGDLIVIGAEYAPHGSIPHAVECSDNVNTTLEKVTLFASNCFGFLEYNCDGSVYLRCRIDRRPPEDDPVKRASARLRSLDADAYHSKHAVKGPSYIECSASFMGDDCVNICGNYHMVMAAQGRSLRVLAKDRMNIQPGDPVELVLYSGERLPDAVAVTVEPAGSIHDDERAFLGRQSLDANLRSARGLGNAFTITLDREVAMARGAILCSTRRLGNDFAVRDCHFGFNRSRGILIKASRGEITGNRMEGCRMSAILVSPEYWWLEAGSSTDLNITGNTILNCGPIPICVEASGGDGNVAPAGAHRHVSISGNTITGCAKPAILVTSTADLRVGQNTLGQWTDSRELPDLMRRSGLKEITPVVEIHCTAAPSWPLKVSSDGRHLETQDGTPFLYTADTSWTMLSMLSVADAKKYISLRKAQGFNAIQTMATGWRRTGSGPRGAFFEAGDVTQPNESFFAGIDEILTYAESQDMLLAVWVLWLADNGGWSGGSPVPAAQLADYATWLGRRYHNRGNLIWFLGGDEEIAVLSETTKAAAAALAAADPNHLISYHPRSHAYELHPEKWLAFNSLQWNANSAPYTYQDIRLGFHLAPPKPILDAEPAYDPSPCCGEDPLTTPLKVRRNGWWAMLSGALGVVYGGPKETWNIGAAGAPDWAQLSRPAAGHTGNIRRILDPLAWSDLDPDFDSRTVTGGGTDGSTNYVTAAASKNRSLIIAYTPAATTLNVDLKRLAGPGMAQWIDPTSAQAHGPAIPVENTGTGVFTTPGLNADHAPDWVLILKTKP